ncbi:MAG TPA: hypothetical protein VIM69_02440, partial [Opitutaceae bacterium]
MSTPRRPADLLAFVFAGKLAAGMKKAASTLRVVLVSCALVVPSLWRAIVSPADLQSHLYNAWLANLVEEGRAPGLFVVSQSTNVLVDLILVWGSKVAPVGAVEKSLAAALVLAFFWGAWRFIDEVHGEPPWSLCPWLGMLSYGFVFQSGFLNFYASTCIVLWLLALTWNRPLKRVFAFSPLLAVAWLGHPLPVIWAVALTGYQRLAAPLPLRRQLLLCFSGLIAVMLGRTYVIAKYPSIWHGRQLGLIVGADQLALYGKAYLPVELGFVALLCLLFAGWWTRRKQLGSVVLQSYVLTAASAALFPNSAGHAGVIAQRLSLYAALLLLAGLGGIRWPKRVLGLG